MSSLPLQFVGALKAETRRSVEGTIKYMQAPEGRGPSEPLRSLGQWYRGLSPENQALVRAAMNYAAEGSLFRLLSVFDNVAFAGDIRGHYELYHVGETHKTRLNNPDGDFLYDLFNELP